MKQDFAKKLNQTIPEFSKSLSFTHRNIKNKFKRVKNDKNLIFMS